MISVAIAFLALLFIGLPIGYVLGVTGILGLLQIGGVNFMAMAPKRYFEGLDLFTFMAMPFFILAGEIMNKSGITLRLVTFTDALVGHMRGGLAHSNIVASTIFAGMTGAAVSDAAALGNTLVPAMVSQGYTRPFACAVTVAGSIIGPTIPPSNLMVIYGSLMGVSIAGLFAAGIVPGLMICVACMAVIASLARKLCLPKSRSHFSLWDIFVSFKASIVPLLMPVIILGGILTGIVTPTEAAAIAVMYAIIVGMFVFRTVSLGDILEMCVRTARVTGIVFLIIAAASILSWWMTFEQIPQAIATFFFSISRDPVIIKALILVLLLFIGMILDINAALIILAPVLGTLTASIGMDPVHAGVMIVLSLNIGLMTPPVGACLFVLCSITGEKLENIAKSLWPFIIVEMTVLVIITFWTDLAMLGPRLLLN